MLSKRTFSTAWQVFMAVHYVLADIATVDVGNPANFVTSVDANDGPQPTGKSLSLHKADNGDVDLNLGDGLVSDLNTALDQNCKDTGPQCEAAVEQVLLSAQYELQSRSIGYVLAAGGTVLAIFVGQVIEMWTTQDKKVPIHFNAPAAQVSSAIANPSATNIAIETGDGGNTLNLPVTQFSATVPAINTATLTSGVLLTEATDAADGHAQGDYLFDIKDQGALTWLQNNAKSSTSCQNSRKMKRQNTFGCAVSAATNAMQALNGPLASLLLIGPTQLPRFANGGDLARAVRAIFDSGRAIAGLVSISENTLWMLAEMFLYLYDQALNNGHPWVENDFIAGSVFEQNPTATSSGGPCPTGDDEYICQDKDCKGDNSGPTCTVSGPKSECSCASVFTPFVNLVDNGWLDTQQNILASMVSYGKSKNTPSPTLNCANDGPAHLNRDWAIGVVSSFCNINAGSKILPNTPPISQNSAQGTQENFDAGAGQNTTLSIGWSSEDPCDNKGEWREWTIDVDECNKQLNSTIDQCDTQGPVDGKHGGQVTEGCIIFANLPQTHPPSPSSTTYEPDPGCTADSDCTWRTCGGTKSTCDTYGAPGVNEIGRKVCDCRNIRESRRRRRYALEARRGVLLHEKGSEKPPLPKETGRSSG